MVTGGPRDVDVHELLVTSESTAKVSRYLGHCAPAGSRHGFTSGSRDAAEPSFYEYEWPELPGLVDGRTLTVEVLERASGGSALRVDSEASYPRPPSERVPDPATYLEVEEVLVHGIRRAGTSDPTTVRAGRIAHERPSSGTGATAGSASSPKGD